MAIHLTNIAKSSDGGLFMATFVDSGKIYGIPHHRLREFLTNKKVENMAMVNGVWKGTQGDLHRYVEYNTTVVGKFTGAHTGYELYVGGRGIVRCSTEEAYIHIRNNGATNAKVVSRNGKNSVVPLKGKFVEYMG